MSQLMTDRKGDWMQTYTGRKFWPLDPRPEDIDIEEIAHALSNICRFGGHVQVFHSVAYHSVLVSQECQPQYALSGLLHDAAEAYCGDIVRPLKRELPSYCEIERRIQWAIADRFWLPRYVPFDVKRADEVLLATEARDVMGANLNEWGLLSARPRTERIIPIVDPRKAERLFMDRFVQLTGGQEASHAG